MLVPDGVNAGWSMTLILAPVVFSALTTIGIVIVGSKLIDQTEPLARLLLWATIIAPLGLFFVQLRRGELLHVIFMWPLLSLTAGAVAILAVGFSKARWRGWRVVPAGVFIAFYVLLLSWFAVQFAQITRPRF